MGNIFGKRDEEDNPNTNRCTALLGPMLGGSFPASLALYNLVHSSAGWVKLLVFGGFTLGIFAVATGLVAGLFGRTPRSASYMRIATITAIVIALALFTAALCTMFQSTTYMIACGLVFGVLTLILVLIGFLFDW